MECFQSSLLKFIHTIATYTHKTVNAIQSCTIAFNKVGVQQLYKGAALSYQDQLSKKCQLHKFPFVVDCGGNVK